MIAWTHLSIPKVLAAAAVALAAGFLVETARAAEAYVCEGGRLVYVKSADLERMKQTDACIAGYYGLKVGGALLAEQVPAAEKAVVAPEIASTIGHVVEGAPLHSGPRGSHRNVRVLNAAPGADPYFKLPR
jgi:hypothetical protein